MTIPRFPFQMTTLGTVAEADYERHVRDMIEEALFTVKGERVNRPDFGSGVAQLVFGTTAESVLAAVQFSIASDLNRFFSDEINVDGVEIKRNETSISIRVSYVLKRLRRRRVETFTL